MQLSLRLETINRKADTFLSALNSLTYGIVLLNAKGRVVECNQVARSLLTRENGIVIRAGQLEAEKPTTNVALQAQIRRILATSEGSGLSSGDTISIPRFDGRQPLVILLAPVPRRLSDRKVSFQASGPGAIVMIKDPDRVPPTKPELLGALYDLTPAEARLAEALVSGERLNDIAVRVGITKGTARSQLKAIFSKTGTHSQTELLRLLLTSATGMISPED